jgi:hypothetical protein
MTLQVSQTVAGPGSGALTTPTALTPAATDTIAATSFGPNGLRLFLVTTGTTTDLTVLDPNRDALGYAGTVPTLTGTATGHRMLDIPLSAIDPATQVATITFSGARTGVSYYLTRI